MSTANQYNNPRSITKALDGSAPPQHYPRNSRDVLPKADFAGQAPEGSRWTQNGREKQSEQLKFFPSRPRSLDTILESQGSSSDHSYEEQDRVEESMHTSLSSSPPSSRFSLQGSLMANQAREHNMKRMLRLRAFEAFIESKEGRSLFRDWLKSTQNVSATNVSEAGVAPTPVGLVKLDRWCDELKTEALLNKLRDQSKYVHDLYYSERPGVHLQTMPPEAHQPSLKSLRDWANVKAGLATSRSWLLQSMYADEFQRFIVSMLVKLTASRLEEELGSHMGSLGEAFVLTNPRVKDNPIVMVSPAFLSMTGYTLEECIGQNCRMLSGPGTSANARQRIRRAFESFQPSMDLLIDYRKDGKPFYCLLNMIPLFDVQGEITYFFAGLVDVTSDLQSSDLMSFLCKIKKNNLSSKMRTNSASRAVVGDSPLMKNFKAGESLEEILDNSQERRRWGESRNQLSFIEREVIDISNGPTNLKRKPIPWISPLTRKGSDSTSSGNSFDSLSIRSGNKESRRNFQSPTTSVSLLEMTYSRVIVFKRPSLDIIFATPGALLSLGLPAKTERDLNMSALLQMKITDILFRTTPKLTKGLKSAVVEAIKRGDMVSCSCTLKCEPAVNPKSSGKSAPTATDSSMVHLTPLMDPKGGVSAYIAILAG